VSGTSAAELAGLLRLGVLRLGRQLRANPADAAVGPGARAVLWTLRARGPLSPGELARLETVRPPAMTRVLAALEGQLLVARTPHPTDRRQSVVTLTEAGSRLIEEIQTREAWLAERIKTLPDADRALLESALPVLDRLTQP
jgi:DNA-binding MarR family transcriptional regulator